MNVRALPGPVPPPGTPYRLVVTLQPSGYLQMKWKCDNPASGVIYNVYRSLDDADPVFIGGAGRREFTSRTWLWSTVLLLGLGNLFFTFVSVFARFARNSSH